MAPAESSRDRLLLAAKNLFATRGYENTSTIAIARAAGTSESQLMKHFGSKDGLLEAIFEHGWEQMAAHLESVRQMSDPLEKLRALLFGTMEALDRDQEMKELMLRHAFRFVDTVIFLVGPQNTRSRRAVEKIGGILAGETHRAGRDSVVYRITAEEFAEEWA